MRKQEYGTLLFLATASLFLLVACSGTAGDTGSHQPVVPNPPDADDPSNAGTG